MRRSATKTSTPKLRRVSRMARTTENLRPILSLLAMTTRSKGRGLSPGPLEQFGQCRPTAGQPGCAGVPEDIALLDAACGHILSDGFAAPAFLAHQGARGEMFGCGGACVNGDPARVT